MGLAPSRCQGDIEYDRNKKSESLVRKKRFEDVDLVDESLVFFVIIVIILIVLIIIIIVVIFVIVTIVIVFVIIIIKK